MEKGIVRLLKADEIECRISVIKENGLSLLLYKDARVDQKILDETFGAFRWMRSHQCIDGNLYCTVEIYDEEMGVWVAKQDVGAAGFAEKEKSQASDSFKRACFNWGIGRELYTAPFIWVSADKAEIKGKEIPNGEKRYYCNEHFSVSSIQYNEDREISSLVIVNDKGQAVYAMKRKDDNGTVNNSTEKSVKRSAVKQSEKNAVNDSGKSPEEDTVEKSAAQKKARGKSLSKTQMDLLKAELERTGVKMEAVQERYQIQKLETMSAELYAKVMAALSKTKSAKAA